MRKIVLKIEPFPVEQIPNMLKEHGTAIYLSDIKSKLVKRRSGFNNKEGSHPYKSWMTAFSVV